MSTPVKAKIVLGKRPEKFAPVEVTFKMPDGTLGVINVSFVYRTRPEYAQLIAETYNRTATDLPKTEDGKIDYEAIAREACGDEALFLGKIIAGWDIDIPPERQELQQLAEEFPAAVVALKTAYGAACNEGRLGN